MNRMRGRFLVSHYECEAHYLGKLAPSSKSVNLLVKHPCARNAIVFPEDEEAQSQQDPGPLQNPNYWKKTDCAELFRAWRFGSRRSTRSFRSRRGTGGFRSTGSTGSTRSTGSARCRRGRGSGRSCKLSAAMGTNLNARIVHLSALRTFCRQS